MELIPKFLKFKVPNLKVYTDSETYYRLILNKLFQSIKKEKENTESIKSIMYNKLRTEISVQTFNSKDIQTLIKK